MRKDIAMLTVDSRGFDRHRAIDENGYIRYAMLAHQKAQVV